MKTTETEQFAEAIRLAKLIHGTKSQKRPQVRRWLYAIKKALNAE